MQLQKRYLNAGPAYLFMFICLDPDQWTMIPVLVKMYKLLINELSNQLEAAIARREEDAEEEDDDDDVSGRK